MTADDKPLSTLVSQGWEVVAYSSGPDSSQASDNFLLRRMKSHKLVKIRKKVLGQGFVVKEMDI
jgi:hypothetical protein